MAKALKEKKEGILSGVSKSVTFPF